MELGGDHVRRRHPALLDQPQHVLGQPFVHEHDGVPQVQRGAAEAQDGRVVQRRADDVDVVVLGLDPEEEQQSRQSERRLLGGHAQKLAKDALGIPRRARGVVHDVAEGPVLGHARRLGVAHLGVRGEAGHVANGEPAGCVEADFVRRGDGDVRKALMGDEGLCSRVLQDVGHLGRHQVVVDRDEVPARLQRREVDLDHLGAVGQQGRDDVADLEALCAQRVHDLIGVAEELA